MGPGLPDDRLPDFLIIGAQKAATTWLRDRLMAHPDIFTPPREVHFFDKADHHARGLGWYRARFVGFAGQPCVGEKTPDYLAANVEAVEGHLPDVHRRIHAVMPEAKLVAVLRDPVRRAVSALHHVIRSGRVNPLLSPDSLLAGKHRHLLQRHGVFDYGFYQRQIDAYLELFPRRQMLFLFQETDVGKEPERALADVQRFLGVPERALPGVAERPNASKSSTARHLVRYLVPALRRPAAALDRIFPPAKLMPSPQTLAALAELYHEENERLFRFLGRRAPWTTPATPTTPTTLARS
jgi:hypothetical protein